MRELIRFLGRGAFAGAIFPFLFVTWSFGPIIGPLFFVGLLYWQLIPGAAVGLVLWLGSHLWRVFGVVSRVSIGTLVALCLAIAIDSYGFVAMFRRHNLSRNEMVLDVVWLWFICTATGGLAGIACPRAHRRQEPKLTYRERTQLYELAEAEAKAAREQSMKGESGNHQDPRSPMS